MVLLCFPGSRQFTCGNQRAPSLDRHSAGCSEGAGAPQRRCAQPYLGVRQGERVQTAVAFRTCHNADRAFRNWKTAGEKKSMEMPLGREWDVLARGLVFLFRKKHSPGRRGAGRHLGSPHARREPHAMPLQRKLRRGRSPEWSVRGRSLLGDIAMWSSAIFEKPHPSVL